MKLGEHEGELIEMNANTEKLERAYNELLEYKLVLQKVIRQIWYYHLYYTLVHSYMLFGIANKDKKLLLSYIRLVIFSIMRKAVRQLNRENLKNITLVRDQWTVLCY